MLADITPTPMCLKICYQVKTYWYTKAQSRRGRFAQTHIKWLSPCYANPSWYSGEVKCASRRYTIRQSHTVNTSRNEYRPCHLSVYPLSTIKYKLLTLFCFAQGLWFTASYSLFQRSTVSTSEDVDISLIFNISPIRSFTLKNEIINIRLCFYLFYQIFTTFLFIF